MRYPFLLALLLVAGLLRRPRPRPGQEEARQADRPRTSTTRSSRFDPAQGEVLEAGAIEMLPDGKVAVGTRRGEIWMIDNAYDRRPEEGEVHPLRPRPARGPRPGLEGRLALRHPAPRRLAHQGHRRRRQGRRVRGRLRRLGDQRRLPRVRLRLAVRQGRQHLDHAVPDRLVQQQQQVPRLGRQGDAGRQVGADHQRRPLARRHRLQRRGRRLLHRQPGPVERHLRPQAPRPSAASSATPTASSGTRSRTAKYLGDAAGGAEEQAAAS